MKTRVYEFWCKPIDNGQQIAIEEIERGRKYYNSMIALLNQRVQEQLPIIEKLSKEDRFLSKIYLLYPWLDLSLSAQAKLDNNDIDEKSQKTKQAPVIYALIAKTVRDVQVELPASLSNGCYTGTYHNVQAAFSQAIGSNRKGVWPGEPYRFRSMRDSRGATCGVHLQGGIFTWGALIADKTSICQIKGLDPHAKDQTSVSQQENHKWERRIIHLKVAKSADPIQLRVKLHRTIPHDAVISHVMLSRVGDYGSKIQWRLLITANLKDEIPTVNDISESVGVDAGVKCLADGSIQVAVTTDYVDTGDDENNPSLLIIPAYAVRMHQKIDAIDRERKELALQIRDKLPSIEGQGIPKFPEGIANFIERNGLHGFGKYLEREHYLHCKQCHLSKRSQAIRKDKFRKFVASLHGRRVYIEKINLKDIAQSKESTNAERKFASLHLLLSLLKSAGAVEVRQIEGRSDDHSPEFTFAEAIKAAGESGKIQVKVARKAIRKFRRKSNQLSNQLSNQPVNLV
jgi:hypothetical protein